MLNLENILEYIRQKLKKHAHFKISSRDEASTRLFFFFSSLDEISSLSFIPGWNFISAKTCKQLETFHHRQEWFHPGTSFILGWNFTCKHPLNLLPSRNIEAVALRCSLKKVFLEIWQNSQENTCARGLSPATLLKKTLWHRFFPVNFVKFLRTPFYREHLWWLLLVILYHYIHWLQ